MSQHCAPPQRPTRRQWLLQLAAARLLAGGAARAASLQAAALGLAGGAAWNAAQAHDLLGPVTPPVAAPPLPLTLHDGRSTQLPALLQGRLTALQLMFTGCTAACPVQGAIFAALEPLVTGPLPGAQLLSLSINPLADDAAALAAWRKRFHAGSAWLAAAPALRHADAMQRFFEGRASAAGSGDRHLTQTYLFDKQGRLAFRCAELASPRDIATAMVALAAR